MDKLHQVAKVLIEKEKISGDEFRDIMESNGIDYDAEEQPAEEGENAPPEA